MLNIAPQTSNQLKVRDLFQAALLEARGVPRIGIERDGRTVLFLFNKTPLSVSLCQDFLTGTAEVNAKKFCDAFQDLKRVIFTAS